MAVKKVPSGVTLRMFQIGQDSNGDHDYRIKNSKLQKASGKPTAPRSVIHNFIKITVSIGDRC